MIKKIPKNICEPVERKHNKEHNEQDMQIHLTGVCKKFLKTIININDIETVVRQKFKVDMGATLKDFQKPMEDIEKGKGH